MPGVEMAFMADDIGKGFELRPSSSQTPFEESERKPRDDEIFLDGLKGAQPKVTETETGLEVEEDHFTGPALLIPSQRALRAQRQIGSHEVPGFLVVGVPFGALRG